MIKDQWQLWPTKVEFYLHLGAEVETHNKELTRIALEKSAGCLDEEIRAYDIHKVESPSVTWLINAFKEAANQYLSVGVVEDVTIRAVVMRKGSHINTHTEVKESDLMLVYWPGGDTGPINSKPNPELAPPFVVEDPSRHLSDLRLPHESRHSVMIRPQAGLLTVAPAHLPHNLHPYMGDVPFIHIVAQARVKWPDQYDRRW